MYVRACGVYSYRFKMLQVNQILVLNDKNTTNRNTDAQVAFICIRKRH